MPTRNIVPRANGEGNIGTTNKKWNGIYANTVTVSNVEANTVTVSNVDVFFMLLKRNKAYKVGDIAYSPNLPSWARLECVVAGTTGSTEPDFSSIENGDMTNDGTAQFIIDDITDGIPVGDVAYRPYLKEGYLACNGQEVNRSDYPRLVALADKYSLWTDNQTNEPWKFGQGNGSTTMLMPNYKDRVLQGGDTAGKKEAGLPNITGTTSTNIGNGRGAMYMEGTDAFKPRTQQGAAILLDNAYTYNNQVIGVEFNASRSSPIYGKSTTVQPPAIVLIPQMKY